jgi:aminomethyltransferase
MRQTPLHDIFANYGAKVVDFHGWALPVQFAGIIEEHLHARTKAGLFDCSHMGEFVLRGAGAIAAFDRLVFSDMISLRVGLCRYSAILNDNAGVIDDCVGLKLAEDELYLVTNAGPLDEVHALIGGIPGVENVSDATAKLDLQGPMARDILLALGFEAVRNLKYWNGLRMTWEGHEIVVTRAGYTGEVGYEIFVPSALAIPLWERLAAHPDVACCGLGARDTLRTEVGYPLNGEDLAPDKSPLESGMERMVKWDKDFVGKAALEAQRDRGDHTVLTAIKSLDRRAPRHGFEIKHNGQVVGKVTSGTFGPSVGCGVGLADLPKTLSAPGIALTAGPKDLKIETASLPVYTGGTCRMQF